MKQALVVATMAVAAFAFGLNYNASKSNTGNIIVSPEFVSKAQAGAILAEVEKSGKTPDEAAVRAAMKKQGVESSRIQKVIIRGITSGGGSKGYGIMLLDEASSEDAASAQMQRVQGAPGAKRAK